MIKNELFHFVSIVIHEMILLASFDFIYLHICSKLWGVGISQFVINDKSFTCPPPLGFSWVVRKVSVEFETEGLRLWGLK
jgi:hypothetical protein